MALHGTRLCCGSSGSLLVPCSGAVPEGGPSPDSQDERRASKVEVRSSAATSPPSRACGRRPGAPCGCCASRSPILRPCESASPTLASSRRCRRRRGLPGAGSFPGPMWRTSCSAMLWGRRAGAIASRTLAQRRSPKRKLRTTRKGRPSNSARRRSTREPSCISSVMVPATRRIEGERSAWALSEPLLILSCQGLELEDMAKDTQASAASRIPRTLAGL